MTKSDLIDMLCESQKLPKGRAELLVNVIFDSMEAALRRGERIEIRGFGSFEIRNYRAYEGRNPRTGVAVNVKPKRLPFFKVGKELKERVDASRSPNGKRAEAIEVDGAPAAAAPAQTGPMPSESEGAESPTPAGANRATA